MTPITEKLLKEGGWTQLQLNWTKTGKTLLRFQGAWKINGKKVEYMEQLENHGLIERAYLLSFAELCDRLNIVLQKIIHSPTEEVKAIFTKEAKDIKHDIDLFIQEGVKIDSRMIEALMMLQLINREIWENESALRGDGDKSDLVKTHKLNSDRAFSKKRISILANGRVDEKLNYIGGLWNYNYE